MKVGTILGVLVTAAWLVGSGAAPAGAAFPGENGLIAFRSERSGNLDIWVMAPDGTGLRNLTESPEDEYEPQWSPDGKRIVFRRGDGKERELWVMNADGSNQKRLTVNEAEDEEPSFSPDGLRIAFESDREGAKDVFVMHANGGAPMNLTSDPTLEQHEPAWSPDGTRIAYWAEVDDEDETAEIWVMNADGTGHTRLTFNDDEDSDADWSPDGTRLVFRSERDGDDDLYVMNADGSDPVRLTFTGDESDPAWSPDGTQIVFESDRDGNDEIYVMNADGSDVRRLTNHSGHDTDPSWQPIPVTTTTVPGTTTTTTLPGQGGRAVEGKRLLLKDRQEKPQKRALKLVAKDPDVGTGAEQGGPGDPTLHGGFLKVVSRSGDQFVTAHDLPAANWRIKGKPGKNKGYKLKKAGPIRTVLVKPGKTLKVVARGDALGHTLRADPDPVHVALGLGSQVYCLTFGGRATFKPGKTFVARKAPAPEACAALLPECGDGLLEDDESCPDLEGPPDGLGVDAVSTHHADLPIPPAANDVDGTGRALVRTRIEVVFFETTTVGELQALMDALGARISSMLRGVRSVVLDIPDPGSVPALDALVAEIEADPIVEMVLKAYEPRADEVPPNYQTPLDATAGPRLDHHLAVRAAAAWNARGAMRGQPTVAVLDFFGDGAPDAALDALVPVQDVTTGNPDEHGYHVAGIIAGRFGGDGSGRGQVTGMVPGTTTLRVVDVADQNTSFLDELNLTIEALAVGAQHGVLNTSLGIACNTPFGDLVNDAWWWAWKVRQMGLEGRVLHLTAASNIDGACPTETAADIGSRFTAASLVPLPIPNLTNVLVVENAVNDAGPVFGPRCLAPGSKFPGDLSGIGSAVWSLTRASMGAGDKTGTSMATPQVAGLAAYLWALDPTLSVAELRTLLLATRRPVPPSAGQGGCSAQDAAPIIDAYAAALALDAAALPAPATAPIRLALLDVDRDGDFDEEDVFEWSVLLVDGVTDTVQEPSVPEYQRYDLNGDGWTGGAMRRTPFDLDRVGSTQYGASQLGEVTQDVEGLEVPYDETALNDLDILCYYAYSDLYTGNAEARRSYLGARRCSGIEMAVEFASLIEPGVPAQLAVSVGRPTASGSEPVADVYVELSPDGATAAPTSGTTNAQGEFQAEISLEPLSAIDAVEVIVQARTAPDGDVLAEEVVRAGTPGYYFDFRDGFQGWQAGFGSGFLTEVIHFTFETGIVRVHGVDSDDSDMEPNAWIFQTLELHPSVTTLSFDVSAHNRAGADAFYRVRLEDQGGQSHTLVDWTLKSGIEGSFTFSTVTVNIVAFAGQTVTFFFEQDGNEPGQHEQIYYDNIRIRGGVPPPTTTTSSTSSTTSTSATTTSVASTSSTSSSTTSSTSTTTTPATSTTTTTLFGTPVVPYRRYDATGPDGPVVMLGDEFTTEMVDLGTVLLELPPVTIDGDPAPDPTTHQTCYAHPGGVLDTCLDVQTRFGLAQVRIGNPVGVCVPTLAPSIAVDAFKCYQATGTALDLAVTLTDDFQMQAVTIGAPELLCTPAEVDGDPLQHAGRYLVCYATAPAGDAGGAIMVENVLHGGPIQVDVGAATGLCVPALRQLVATCELCGDGNLDPGEECDDGNTTGGDGCSAVCREE
jgi:cysteine-rich repeat protein